MTIQDDFLKLKETSDELIKIIVETCKIDVLCDKIEKLCKAWKDRSLK